YTALVRSGLTGHGGAEVGVQEARRVAARLELRPDLLGREPGLLDALANDVRQRGVLLHRLLQRPLRLAGWRQGRVLGGGGSSDCTEEAYPQCRDCEPRRL